MKPKQYDIDPANVDRNGIAEAQQLVGAGDLTLNGALADLGTAERFDITDSYSSDIAGVQIGIYSAADLSLITFTVTGKDQNGAALSEEVTGPNNAVVETTGYFSQVTAVSADAAVGSDVEVGTVDEVVTRTLPIDREATSGAALAVTVTGTINYTVQETFDDIQNVTPQWHSIAALTSKTASLVGSATIGATAVRLVVNSYTDTAEIQLDRSQPHRG